MVWLNEFHKTLTSVFEDRRSEKADYSIRKFAKDIQVPVSALSEMMRGMPSMTKDRAAKILDYLNLSPRLRARLQLLLDRPVELTEETLSNRDHAIITDWRYLAVLHFFDLSIEDKSMAALSRQFGFPISVVEEITSDLIERGLLMRDELGQITGTDKDRGSSDGITSGHVRLHHLDNLNVTRQALEKLPIEDRDFTSTTFAGSVSDMAEIRKEIRDLHTRIATRLEGASVRDRVVRLNISFFPLDFDGEKLP